MQEENKMEFREETLNSREIFQGRIIKVRVDTVKLPDGGSSTREIVEHAPAVAIVALDDEQNIKLVRQFRKPVEKMLLEIPAGIMEPGEEPLASARRELEEETGFRADRWEKILTYYSAPGFSDEALHVFLARDLSRGTASPDEDEFLQVVELPLEKAYSHIFDGQIVDGKSIIGIQYAYWRMVRGR